MKHTVVGAVAAACLVACAPPTERLLPGVLRTADPDDVPTLDPAVGYDTTSWRFEQMLFSTLLDYDEDSRLVPELATRWQSSPDGTAITFWLEREARFSNGRPVVAADVKYSIERVLRPGTRSPGAEFFSGIAGASAVVDGAATEASGIEVVGDHMLRFRLAAFDPLFLHKLAMQFAAVVPREVAEVLGEDFGTRPVGSGPFLLDSWERGRRLRFSRNPTYFRPGVPRLPGLEHLVGVNEQLEWMKFEAGELDVAAIPPSEFPRVIRESGYRDRLVAETSMTTTFLGMNCQVAPFDDPRVRRAVGLAIDREKALRLINRRGQLPLGILPPGMPGHETIEGAAAHDPAAARTMLRAAGHEGFQTVLWTRTEETALRLAQSYQQDLATIGVHARIKNLSWASFLEAIETPALVPMFMLAWQADFPDPSNFLEVLFHSKNIGANNYSFFADGAVDQLLDTAAATIDPAARLARLSEAHRLILAHAPWVLLYHPTTYEVIHPRVAGYRLHPLRPPRYEEVELRY